MLITCWIIIDYWGPKLKATLLVMATRPGFKWRVIPLSTSKNLQYKPSLRGLVALKLDSLAKQYLSFRRLSLYRDKESKVNLGRINNAVLIIYLYYQWLKTVLLCTKLFLHFHSHNHDACLNYSPFVVTNIISASPSPCFTICGYYHHHDTQEYLHPYRHVTTS